MEDTTTPAQLRARLALALGIAGVALWIGWAFIPAILWAAVITIALEPVRRRAVARWPGRDTVIAGVLATVVTLVVIVPLAAAIAQALLEAQGITQWYANARASGIPVPAWVATLPVGSSQLSAWWTSHLATPQGAAEQLARIDMDMVLDKSKTLGHTLVERIVVFGFTVTILFFLIRDRNDIAGQLALATERAFGASGLRLGRQIVSSIRGTIDGLVLVGLAQGVIMAGVYAVAGVPHPILLGLLSGIGAMVPFGLLVIMAIALLLLLAQGAVVAAVVVAVLGFVLNFVADHFVRPGLIGGSTKLPFVWVLIGIVGGVETIGLLGLFVGPAAMAALILVWREWIADGDPGISADSPTVPVELPEAATT